MKKTVMLLAAAALLLSLAGCGEQEQASTQGQEQASTQGQESEAICKDLAEGGICLEQMEKDMRELGYDTIIQPLDWDDSVHILEMRLGKEQPEKDYFNASCYAAEDGRVLALRFYHSVKGKGKEQSEEAFCKQVEKTFADICQVAPVMGDSFVKDYIPVPDELFAKYRESTEGEAYSPLIGGPDYGVYLKTEIFKDKINFYYSISADDGV